MSVQAASIGETGRLPGLYEPFDGRIAAQSSDVLPRLPLEALAGALRRLPRDELEEALRHKILPVVSVPGLTLYAVCGEAAKAKALREGLKIVAETDVAVFHEAVRQTHAPFLLRDATHGFAFNHPDKSASRRLTPSQILLGGLVSALVAAACILLPGRILGASASLLGGLFFLAVIALRILCLLPPISMPKIRPRRLNDSELPVYSVLVPLFREASVLGQLLRALTDLDYPPDRLDIKIILEESDISMQRAVAELRLPPQFEVIVVPSGAPQTKPRALNYGLHFARGDLLTIFDAEDIPDPQQLRLAAGTFASLPRRVACLQAELAFYNSKDNWLTRQFAIEYATLFGLLLPALANHGLPLPLGGTSNHFRIGVLREIGAWDPFNVTEDADLGFRLARSGYEIATIDSRTYEEAANTLPNWQKQRSRWFKGFLATWLVHMRQPSSLVTELGPAGFWATQALTIGVFASALLHPFCLVATLALLILQPPPSDPGFWMTMLGGLNLLVFVLGYGVAIAAGHRALHGRNIALWIGTLATMPFYWILMCPAAWMALWQFITAPSYWNKTEHGLSAFQKRWQS